MARGLWRALAGATLSAAVVAVAVVPTSSPVVAYDSLATPADYAAEAFGDPWDFENPEDLVIADDGPMRSATNVTMSGGLLRFDMDRPGYLHPLWGGYPGSLVHGREGAARPIDASRFSRIVFRMYADAEVPAGVRWYSCQELTPCQGGFNFFTVPGWHTYDLPLVAIDQPSLTLPWAGRIVSLRIALSPPGPTHFEIDWIRVAPAGVAVTGEDVGPVPVVEEPDASGGADYAAVARQDPWDFAQPGDVLRMDNVAGEIGNGALSAANGAPQLNDPAVTLRLGPAFRGEQFHRVTVAYTYEGPFNLEDRAGGGMVARVIWRVAGTPLTRTGADLQNSDDIVTYPNEGSFTIDLASEPPAAVTDPDQNGPRVGWSNQLIEMVRIDPNEDRGARRWRIDDVKVADDDAVAVRDGQRSFDIVWRDDAYQPGTVADLYWDRDDRGFDGSPIATAVAVQPGRNTYTWRPPADLGGRAYVYVVHRRAGALGRSYATGPVRLDPATPYTFGAPVGGPSSQAGWIDPALKRAATSAAPANLALAPPKAPRRPTRPAPKAGAPTTTAPRR